MTPHPNPKPEVASAEAGVANAFNRRVLADEGRAPFGLGGERGARHLALVSGGETIALFSWAPSKSVTRATLRVSTTAAPEADALEQLMMRGVSECTAATNPLEFWLSAPTVAENAAAQIAGFTCDREVLQLRVPLPLSSAAGKPLPWRAFEPDTDQERFLDINRQAFAWHPEQGDMSQADLVTAMAEPWFAAEQFLLHPVQGAFDGFCWMKIHRDTEPNLGEIYVIGVHPEATGRGIGRGLAVAGMDLMSELGLDTGMLYVEADNAAALGLYDSMGFTEHLRDRRFTLPADPPAP